MKKIIKIMEAKELPVKTRLDHDIFDGLVEVEFTRNSPLKLNKVQRMTKKPSEKMFDVFSALRS